jgi:hypothetical protein
MAGICFIGVEYFDPPLNIGTDILPEPRASLEIQECLITVSYRAVFLNLSGTADPLPQKFSHEKIEYRLTKI